MCSLIYNMEKSKKMTILDIQKVLNEFDLQRGWVNLDPCDLAKSIVLESAELLEHFQWDNTFENRNTKNNKKDLNEISLEVADIFIYLMKFCREMNIDLVDSVFKKLKIIEIKYPKGVKDLKNKSYKKEYLKIKKEYRNKKS